LFDVATGKEVRAFAGPAYTLTLAFSPDGKTLATPGEKAGTIWLWDIATGQTRRKLEGAGGEVSSLAFAPDGKVLASAGGDKTVRLWDPALGTELRRLAGHEKDVCCLTFAPDGKVLASGSPDQTVRLWDPMTGRELRALTDRRERVTAVAFAPDGRLLACSNADGTISLWDPGTGKEVRHWDTNTRSVPFASSLAFSPDGKMLLSTALWQSGPRLWDVATGKELLAFSGHHAGVDVLAYSADGKTLYSAGREKQVLHWDLTTGRESQRFRWTSPEFSLVALSPDGKTAATQGQSEAKSTVRLWDLATGKELRSLGQIDHANPGFNPSSITFSPDGKLLAAAGNNAALLWNVATGEKLRQFGHPSSFTSLAFTPDGKRLAGATGGQNAAVRIWDVERGFMVWAKRTGPVNGPMGLTLSPDGKQVATFGWDGPVRLWDIESAKEVRSFGDVATHGVPQVYQVVFSPDGRFLATAGGDEDRKVHIWEVSTGREVRRFQGHATGVCSVAFAPDGRTVASGGGESMILVWDVTGRLKDGRLQPVDLTPRDLEARWDSLADSEASRAVQAVWELAASPTQAVPFLRKQLAQRPEPVDAQRLTRLIGDLDSEQFAVRAEAAKELERLGEAAEPALRKVLAGKPSTEVHQRVELLLAKLEPERLRTARAVQALEYAGTAEARQVLQILTREAPEGLLKQEAKAALARLAGRPLARP
jgi:WD40 repeat protein